MGLCSFATPEIAAVRAFPNFDPSRECRLGQERPKSDAQVEDPRGQKQPFVRPRAPLVPSSRCSACSRQAG